MTTNKLPIHGRDHRPGGADPIPFPQTAVLDWVEWTCQAASVPISDGTGDPNGWGQKWGEGAVILSSSGSLGFSVAAQTLTDASGTSSRNVLRLPAGYYLCQANTEINNLFTTAQNNTWDMKITAKTVSTGWTGDPGHSTSNFTSVIPPGPAGAIWADLLGAQVKHVEDTDSGFGFIDASFLNGDPAATPNMSAFMFALCLTLGIVGDANH